MNALLSGLVMWSGCLAAASEDDVSEVWARAGVRAEAWREAYDATEGPERKGFAFLLQHMPQRDLAKLAVADVAEHVRLAYEARAKFPWAKTVPEDVFLNDVLPYAHVSESRDPWRAMLLERFADDVADCKTPAEVAQRLNERVFPELGVRYSTQRKRADQSPKESIEQGMASCTGLSILLANACRAVGVPARLAGIASWPNKSGNHTWVEVWSEGTWHFTGAAEPSGHGLNHAWFQGDAALAIADQPEHAIWAVSYRPTPDVFPMVWAPGTRSWGVNVTHRYTGEKQAVNTVRLMVKAVTRPAGKRVTATVRVLVDGAAAFDGETKDEGADTNDLLTFDLPAGTRVTLEVTWAGVTQSDERVLPASGQDVAVFEFGDEEP